MCGALRGHPIAVNSSIEISVSGHYPHVIVMKFTNLLQIEPDRLPELTSDQESRCIRRDGFLLHCNSVQIEPLKHGFMLARSIKISNKIKFDDFSEWSSGYFRHEAQHAIQ